MDETPTKPEERKPEVQIFEGKDGQWYWRLEGANGEVMAVSEGFVSKSNAVRGAKAALRLAPNAVMELQHHE